jgi:hypothetical protein
LAGAGLIAGGVAAFGAGQDMAAAVKAAQANVEADNARADKAETRASDMAKAAAEERKLAAVDRIEAAEVLRKKGEAAEAAVLRKKKIDDAKAARDTLLERARGGASFESVRGAASEDEALGEWDDSNVQSLYDEVAREKAERAAKEADAKQKTRKTESEISRNEAAATKARRGPAPPKPIDPQRQRILDLTEEEKRLSIEQMKGGKPLEATVVKDIAEADATMAAVKDLERRNPDIGTGFFRSVQNTLAQVVGIDDPATTKFRADTANLTNEIISRLSGANVPPPEMERIAQGIPQFGDDDVAFKQKLKATWDRVERARTAAIAAAKAGGRNVAGFEKAPAAVPAAENAEAEAATDEELEALAKGG